MRSVKNQNPNLEKQNIKPKANAKFLREREREITIAENGAHEGTGNGVTGKPKKTKSRASERRGRNNGIGRIRAVRGIG